MAKVNIDKIAQKLGARRRGAIEVRPGSFGAMELLAEVQERFRVPPQGGRATDASLTVQRQIALHERTYKRLVSMAESLTKATGRSIGPLQVGTLLLEHAADEVAEADIAKMLEAGWWICRCPSPLGRVRYIRIFFRNRARLTAGCAA
jgi:hypothetical protein